MTTMTPGAFTPSPFASDPFYALGATDARNEHAAGEDVHLLKRRADEMLEKTPTTLPSDLYVIGYATTVIGLLNGHMAQINAESDVTHRWHDRKHGRSTDTAVAKARTAAKMRHPSMRATRQHLATNQLPRQRQIGGAA